MDIEFGCYEKDTKQESQKNRQSPKKERTTIESGKWDLIFKDKEVFQPEGLAILLDRFIEEFKDEDDHQSKRPIDLYQETLSRIEAGQALSFIDALLRFGRIDFYDFKQILTSIPMNWLNKVSFKKKWPEIIKDFGVKYSRILVHSYSFQSTLRELDLDESFVFLLKKGVF